jgi:nucleoside transporter
MMFLQYFVWGAWYVTLGTYLTAINFKGSEVGLAYSAAAWAAIISPFFVGMIADRFFSGQKVLGILHLVGAAILLYASTIRIPVPFFWVILLYLLCYMPTLALTNAIAFRNMDNPSKQFPLIRVLGTIGWIVAGYIVGRLIKIEGKTIENTEIPMQIAAACSALLGVYSFFLPKTPPQSAGKAASFSKVLGLDAIKLMKQPSFAIFAIASLLICIPLTFYYNWTNPFLNELGVEDAAFKQTFGQMSEILFMVLMPLFFVRLGVKWMLAVGMLAWVVRYVLFALGDAGSGMWMLYGGIILHGICYDFFFVTGQIYVDRKAPLDLRASAQGFLALLTLGIGMLIGAWVAGFVVERYTDAATKVHDWQTIWLIPAAMAAVVLIIFVVAFRDKAADDEVEQLPTTGEPLEPEKA